MLSHAIGFFINIERSLSKFKAFYQILSRFGAKMGKNLKDVRVKNKS